jgi:hypothetical protein
MAGRIKDRRCHVHHREVHQPRDRQCDDHVDVREAHDAADVAPAFGDNTVLREGGVQVDRMRHDGCANDADGQKNAGGAANPRHDRVIEYLMPVRLGEQGFDDVTDGDDADQRSDQRFHGAKAVSVQR